MSVLNVPVLVQYVLLDLQFSVFYIILSDVALYVLLRFTTTVDHIGIFKRFLQNMTPSYL
jgi:riboflavin transporter FmnP